MRDGFGSMFPSPPPPAPPSALSTCTSHMRHVTCDLERRARSGDGRASGREARLPPRPRPAPHAQPCVVSNEICDNNLYQHVPSRHVSCRDLPPYHEHDAVRLTSDLYTRAASPRSFDRGGRGAETQYGFTHTHPSQPGWTERCAAVPLPVYRVYRVESGTRRQCALRGSLPAGAWSHRAGAGSHRRLRWHVIARRVVRAPAR